MTRPATSEDPYSRGIRAAQLGIVVNAGLAAIKLIAGIAGHAYALVADAVESTADIAGSLIVWGGLAVASRPPDERYPYGQGKAESLAAGAVALLVLGAGVGIAIQAIREIVTPHLPPAPWTLAVLVAVVLVKTLLSGWVTAVGAATRSHAVAADAWHHLSDAVTSAAAFIGISVALIGSRFAPGGRWATADDWAALFASGIIVYNGLGLLRPALADLMDRTPDRETLEAVRRVALAVPGVLAVEKLAARRAGLVAYVDIHVQAAPETPLEHAHAISGRVKHAVRSTVPGVAGVLVHMEPFVAAPGSATPPSPPSPPS